MTKLSALDRLKAAKKTPAPQVETPITQTLSPGTTTYVEAADLEWVTPNESNVLKSPEVKSASTCTRLNSLDLEVFEFISNVKVVGVHDIPVKGASTVELAAAFPDVNVNTLRYAVWHLRKADKIFDNGLRRTFGTGKMAQVVWEASLDGQE